ncbi:hypothetical protein EU527_07235 [Candidatus Thorarchaeota archaeon]|nr:MAG: hypothetical protein EU527_07235 [Candidatus Thorarchaeota archaeon]
MNTIIDIGLPDISEEVIELLAEECEAQIINFIRETISEKSIETLFVSCSLNLIDGQLDIEIDIDISQSYDTGHNLDDLLQKASDCGVDWLEKQLMEMKNK